MWPFIHARRHQETVADYVSPSVYQSAQPWLCMLELNRSRGRKTEFEVVACRLHDDFNLKLIPWQDENEGSSGCYSLEDFPHIMERLAATWQSRECLDYLNGLLEETREGTRSGFPLPVFRELLLLAAMLETLLAPAWPARGLKDAAPVRPAVGQGQLHGSVSFA